MRERLDQEENNRGAQYGETAGNPKGTRGSLN